MRRITLWLFSTVAALVLLFSYRTSTMGAGQATTTTATGPQNGPQNGAPNGDKSMLRLAW